MNWLFNGQDYRAVLKSKIELEESARGYRASLAKAAGCQAAYLSQVLKGDSHFTPEHAAGVADFWALSDLESEYFLNLVLFARAGTPALERKLKRKLEQLRQERAQGGTSPFYAQEKAPLYYLDWVPSAVHVLLAVPGQDQVSALAERLSLNKEIVLRALVVLKDLGIVQEEGSRWHLTNKRLHASDESLYAPLHHRNWREQAVENFRHGKQGKNFHYTATLALSYETLKELRGLARKMVDDTTKLVMPSPEETVACLTLDLFEL